MVVVEVALHSNPRLITYRDLSLNLVLVRVTLCSSMTAIIPPENDVEVGESVPPMTAHVSHSIASQWVWLTSQGCQRVTSDMESQRWIRGGRRMGSQQNENGLPQVHVGRTERRLLLNALGSLYTNLSMHSPQP